LVTHEHVSDPELRLAGELDESDRATGHAARLASLILGQLRAHAPFTLFGTLTGITILVTPVSAHAPAWLSQRLFWGTHPDRGHRQGLLRQTQPPRRSPSSATHAPALFPRRHNQPPSNPSASKKMPQQTGKRRNTATATATIVTTVNRVRKVQRKRAGRAEP